MIPTKLSATKFVVSAPFMAAAVALLSAGCTTNQLDPRVLAQFAPEHQAMIRRGEIAVGFTPVMVRLARGGPNQVQKNPETPGSEIWTYGANAGLWSDRTRVLFLNGAVAAVTTESRQASAAPSNISRDSAP